METLRIMLVDDHALFRQGVKSLLDSRPDLEVVASAANGNEAIALARECKPDVILMDIEMPDCDGIEATRQIKQELPEVKIVALTVVDDDETVFEMIKSGAQGYLLKDLEAQQLFEMLEGLRRGNPPLSGQIAAKIIEELTSPASTAEADTPEVEPLTERELDVLRLLVDGLSNKEIAQALTVTENTVKTHLTNILAKLHVRNRIQAAVYAATHGLVDPPDWLD
ncbi:MAG TPA: response regulator transcription factor [Aggregatilineales bacterium]|nr:response regulator transcription factor [Aggregatilineales bacterium]